MKANAALTAARFGMNLSRDELADAINRVGAQVGHELRCSARQIAKWESGAVVMPQARYRRALEAVTGVPCAMLGFYLDSDAARDMDEQSTVDEEDPMHRRSFMGYALGLAAAPFLKSLGGGAVRDDAGGVDADDVNQALNGLQDLELRVGSGHLLPVIDEQVNRLNAVLQKAGESTALQTLAARAHQLAGWMHFDSGNQARSRSLYKEALFLAQTAGDRSQVAYTSSLLSMQASELGRPKEAIQLARLGAAQLAPGGLASALLAVREARGWALLGAARESNEMLKQARRALDMPGPRRTGRPSSPTVRWKPPRPPSTVISAGTTKPRRSPAAA